MELHILITQGSFNTAHETHLHAFYVYFPSSERQKGLSVWNDRARRGVAGLDSFRSYCTFIPSDTLLKKGTFIQNALQMREYCALVLQHLMLTFFCKPGCCLGTGPKALRGNEQNQVSLLDGFFLGKGRHGCVSQLPKESA